MVNMTVIRLKDTFKYLVGITLVITLVMSITRYFSNINIKKQENIIKTDIENSVKKIFHTSMLSCLDLSIPAMKSGNKYDVLMEEETQEVVVDNNKKSMTEILFNIGLGMSNNIAAENHIIADIVENEQEQDIEEAKSGVATEIIDNSGINTKFTNTYGSVQIKNESKYELTEDMITPNLELNDKKNILLFHTHTCESYTSNEEYSYEPTGTFRTTDLNYTVARTGREFEKYLSMYGYNVVHDETYHDYPAFSGSYNRSLKTVENLLKANKSTEIVFDIHRDAIGANSNYAPTIKIGEEYVAQIMFVIGTDGGGLSHSEWVKNLKFAVKIQEKANEMYPGLFKPIILRNSRYNQHVSSAATIIEIGATGNTLDQTLNSMKYLAKVVNEVVK